MSLRSCGGCDGLIPRAAVACPHCERPAPRARWARRIAGVIGGGAMAVTLMACYGGPPRCAPGTDDDGDHACTSGRGAKDCNDHDPLIRPYAEDQVGDGVDQNCDGVDGMAGTGTGTGTGSGTGTGTGTGTAPP